MGSMNRAPKATGHTHGTPRPGDLVRPTRRRSQGVWLWRHHVQDETHGNEHMENAGMLEPGQCALVLAVLAGDVLVLAGAMRVGWITRSDLTVLQDQEEGDDAQR